MPAPSGSSTIYDVDLVRKLCVDISASKDPQRIDELLGLIQAILSDNQDELRVRLTFLREKYAGVFDSPKPEGASNDS